MKVLLIDDHPLILSALQTVICSVVPGVTVVGVNGAVSARAALVTHTDFDLILLDLALDDADGFELLLELREAHPALPVVVISATERAGDVIRAIDSGAMGFVPKRSSQDNLFEALRVVMTGGVFLPEYMLGLLSGRMVSVVEPGNPSTVADLAAAAAHQQVTTLDKVGLTPRQTEVLALLLQAKPNKLIARELNLSVETVKDHVAAVLRALGVSTRTQAVMVVSQMTQARGGFPTRKV